MTPRSPPAVKDEGGLAVGNGSAGQNFTYRRPVGLASTSLSIFKSATIIRLESALVFQMLVRFISGATSQSSPLEEMPMDRKRGRYLGTEIDEKWWKRYTKEGFFARGKGEYWYDDKAFYFLRYLTRDPIAIPFDKVSDLKVGPWHCGRRVWGNPIVKFLWSHQGQSLSSGFVLSYEKAEVERLVNEISRRVHLPTSERGT